MPTSHPHIPLQRQLAGAVLTLLLGAGGHVAYGAEPAAPERLAAQAAGVVGSGDQLSLRIRAPEGEWVVKVGELYADGWTLKALTATKATLAKDGTIREVGLNPTGAVASNAPAAPPTTVTLIGLPNEAMIQAYIDKNPAIYAQAMASLRPLGLTDPEMRRYFAESMMVREGTGDDTLATLDMATLRAVLGQTAADDYIAIRGEANTAVLTQRIADLRARPFTGPDTYYVPAGADAAQVAASQNVDARAPYRSSPPDAQGGVTRTRTAQTANEMADGMSQALAANPSLIPGAEVRPAQ